MHWKVFLPSVRNVNKKLRDLECQVKQRLHQQLIEDDGKSRLHRQINAIVDTFSKNVKTISDPRSFKEAHDSNCISSVST